MKQATISVTVTTYKRPKMVEDLIKSFLFQSYKASELVILDDCVEDTSTQKMIQPYLKKDPRIRFIKNHVNLGYSKNFLKSLTECKGDYIITLGDDDILLQKNTLERYVNIFEKYKDVGFIYSNIIQFNNAYEADYVYKIFEKNTYFNNKEEALKKIWLKSCYIPGIGLRNNVDFTKLYPQEDWLFPQVEMIGKILATSNAYGFTDFLIGGRAHDDQLGLHAVKGERIKKTERHSSLELPEIFDKIKLYFQQHGYALDLQKEFVNDFFQASHATILPTEKINTGNINVLRVFIQGVKVNPKILLDTKYIFYLFISLLTPAKQLIQLKEWYKKRIVKKHFAQEQELFNSSITQIGLK